MNNQAGAWEDHYNYARETLGYEPGEAWAYADRESPSAT